MHVVVVGCTPVGVELARDLQQAGHTVAVVDRNERALGALGDAFGGLRIAGREFDRDILARAGIERADGLAALTDSDKTNALAAHVARTAFKVSRVVALLVDRRHRETYEHLRIPTVAPGIWGAQRVRALLLPSRDDSVLNLGNGEVEVVNVTVPDFAVGRTAGELARPGEIALVALVRAGRALVPVAGTVLEAGDVVYLSVADAARPRLEDLFGGNAR